MRLQGTIAPGQDQTLARKHPAILQSVGKHPKVLQSLRKHPGILQSAGKHARILQSVRKHPGILQVNTREYYNQDGSL